jgi:hypothetical protein
MRSLMGCTSHPILYIDVIQQRRMRLVRHMVRVGTRETYAMFWLVRPVGKGTLRRARRRWEGNIYMEL